MPGIESSTAVKATVRRAVQNAAYGTVKRVRLHRFDNQWSLPRSLPLGSALPAWKGFLLNDQVPFHSERRVWIALEVIRAGRKADRDVVGLTGELEQVAGRLRIA